MEQVREEFDVRNHSVADSKLLLVSRSDELLAFAEFPDDAQSYSLEPWASAVHSATRELGNRVEATFDLFVGPAPESRHDSSTRWALAEEIQVGEFQLRPAATLLVEDIQEGLGSWSTLASFPTLVTGPGRGYDWGSAQNDFIRKMRRLCALLSLAWDVTWTTRTGPMRFTFSGPVPLPVPGRRDHGFGPDPDRLWTKATWIDGAWTLLDEDPRLAQALDAHFEGLRMESNHPSYATIAYVGAIEGIAAFLPHAPPLEKCCEKGGYSGRGRRFRYALSLVLEQSVAQSLGSRFYEFRSKTAHSGKLHGQEPWLGKYFGFEFLAPSTTSDFIWRDSSRLKSASGQLLTAVAK